MLRAATVRLVLATLAFCLLGLPRAAAAQGLVLAELPAAIDPHANYLIYLHGRIIEEEGPHPTSPRFGTYEYRLILDALAARGFTVVSEVRPRGTDIAAYAGKVAGQVRSLLAAGVPPRRVAVVGFSKGGAIALVAASSLHHREVRFVSLAGCGDWLFDHFKLDLAGRVLSLYDVADDLASSCARAFTAASKPFEHREIVLHVGKGHGTFFRPDPAWLDPVTEWLAPERRAPSAREARSRPAGMAAAGLARQAPGAQGSAQALNSSPCAPALREGTVGAAANDEGARLLAAKRLAGAVLVQDVRTGALIAFASSPPPADTRAGRAEIVDVATPLLPLSLAKLFLAASAWDHAADLLSRNPLLRADLHEMLVSGSDSAGRRIAIDLRRALGAQAVLADLERFGLRRCPAHHPAAAEDTFWSVLAPRWRPRLVPAAACVSILPVWSDDQWGSALSIGETGFSVTLLHVSRFLQAVGNGGVLVAPAARARVGEPALAERSQRARRGAMMSAATANNLQSAMRDTVLRGTATGIRGRLGEWAIGGKTGSYAPDARPWDGCFAGLVFDHHKVARYTVVSYVKHGGKGGGAAAQVALDLVKFTLGL